LGANARRLERDIGIGAERRAERADDAKRADHGRADKERLRSLSGQAPSPSPSRPWTSTPEPTRFAPRVPPRAPADASGPSFELFGDDESSSSSPRLSVGTVGAVGAVAQMPTSPNSAAQNSATFASFATLRGEIRRVTFHNADNFYTVARVRVASADVASLPAGATAAPQAPEGSKYSKYSKYKKRGRGAKGGASLKRRR
jgi:hypothetical protein